MRLIRWIKELLARTKGRASRARPSSDGGNFVELFVTRLEERRVLNADFTVIGNELELQNFDNSDLTVQESATDYTFTLSGGMWSQVGIGDPGVTAAGDQLTVDKAQFTLADLTVQDTAQNSDVDIEFASDFSIGGTIEFVDVGEISQAGATSVAASILEIAGADLVTLDGDNDFDGVAVDSLGAVNLHDVDSVAIVTLTATSGITSGDIVTLTAEQNIDVDADIMATGDISIDAGNDVSIDAMIASCGGEITIAGSQITNTSTGSIDANSDPVTLDGNVQPGGSPGILPVVGDLSLADNSTLTVELGGTTPGNGAGFHDQIDVMGMVTIGSSVTLSPSLFGGFVPIVNDTFVIVNNDGIDLVNGEFDGLGEGDTLNIGSQAFVISYIGGDGNDIELSAGTPVYDFDLPAFSTSEGNATTTNNTVTITRSGNTSIASTVDVELSAALISPADPGADFTAGPITVSFAVGQTSAAVPIEILGDTTVEADEVIDLALSNFSSGGMAGTTSTSTLTLVNDDSATLTITGATHDESDSGIVAFEFNVELSAGVQGGLTLGFAVNDGTATDADDFDVITFSPLSFTGTAGEIQTIRVDVVGDTFFEGGVNEEFEVALGTITTNNAAIDVATFISTAFTPATGTITNDDTPTLVQIVGGDLIISEQVRTGKNDNLEISLDPLAAGGPEIVVRDTTLFGGVNVLGSGSATASDELRFKLADVTGRIIVNTGLGDDVLTVDFSSGSPLPTSGLMFNGGGQTSRDGLAVIGDAATTTAVYTPDGATPGSGTINVDGFNISFADLEPVDLSGMLQATVEFANADEVVTITNGADFFGGGTNDALRVSGSSGGVAIETVALWNNTTVVIDTVTNGIDGTDSITIASADNLHNNSNLTFFTGANGDTVTYNGAVRISGTHTITSTDADVNDNNDVAVDIAAAKLVVAAATFGDAGANNSINTDVSELSINTSAGGDQFIDEANGLSAIDLDAGTGTIILTAGSSIEDADVNSDIVAGQVALSAVGGIGGAKAIDTSVTNLAFNNTTGGDVNILNTGTVAIDSVGGLLTSTNSAGDVTLAATGSVGFNTAVDVMGALDVSVDANGGVAATFTSNSTIVAGSFTLTGNGTDEVFTFNDTLQTDDAATGAILIRDADVVDFNADVTAKTSLTIENVGTRIDLAGDVDLTAQAGDVNAVAGVAGILLSGGAGTSNVVSAIGGSVSLAPVTDNSPDEFEINADTDITTSSITITNLLDVNLQDIGTSKLTAGGPWSASMITVDGAQTAGFDDDEFHFGSTITSTTAGITITQASSVDFDGDVTAANTLLIDKIASEIDLAANVDLLASLGDVTINGPIDLSGSTGINRISSPTGNVDLQQGVTESGSPDELEINAANNVIAVSTNITNLLDINADADNDGAGSIEATGTLGTGTADFSAATGIGDANPLSTAVAMFDDIVNDTSGNININNSLATPVSVDVLSLAGGGNITFNQSGGGSVSFTTVTTSTDGTPAEPEDNISLTNTGGDLIIAGNSVVADGFGDIRYTTTVSGDVRLVGLTTAIDDDVTIDAAGAVVDGDTNASTDILARNLLIKSGTGVGSNVNPLETELRFGPLPGNFEADGGTGGVHIVNTGDLIIGGIGAGLMDTVGAPVGVTANGGGISIEVMSDLNINAPVRELGGGSILFVADGDLNINNSAPGPMISEVEVVGAGTIRGEARGFVTLAAPGGEFVIVRTATGEIVNVPAVVTVVAVDQGGSNVNVLGVGLIDVTIGDPGTFGEMNFRVINNWNDFPANAPIDDHPLPGNASSNPAAQFDAGTHRYSHTYRLGNPDIFNPAADIPVDVTVRFDPRTGVIEGIEFFASGVKLESTVRVLLTVPGEGLIGFIIIQESEIVPIESRDEVTTFIVQQTTQSAVDTIEDFVAAAVAQDDTIADRDLLFFTIISPDGKEGQPEYLQIDLLEKDRILDLFKTFPNNVYHIYLKQSGSTDVLRLYRIEVIGNKIRTPEGDAPDDSKNEGEAPGQDAPPPPEDGAAFDARGLDEHVSFQPPMIARVETDAFDVPADLTFATIETDVSADVEAETSHSIQRLNPLAAGAIAASGLIARGMRGSWRREVDEAMQSGGYSLSKTARLCRRLRE